MNPKPALGKKISVLLADDNEIYLTGLSRSIRKISYVSKICSARNSEEIETLLRNVKLDVLLLNLSMCHADMDNIKRIRDDFPQLKMVAMSQHNCAASMIPFIKAGGNGLLLKDTTTSEIQSAFSAILVGNNYLSPVIQSAIAAYSTTPDIFSQANLSAYKNQKLKELLLLICKEYTTRQIAEELHINEKTVEKYRGELMRLTGAKNVVGLAMYALKHKLIEVS